MYEREVERYGGPDGIELAEAVFHADSAAVLEILRASPRGEEAAGERWRLGVAGAALLLRDIVGDEAHVAVIVEELRDAYRAEHRAGRDLVRDLGRRFRAERTELEALFATAVGDASAPSPPWRQALQRRSERLAAVADELRVRERTGRLDGGLDAIARSLVHMHVVRLLRSDARRHELVIYDALARLEAGAGARRQSGAAR